MISWIKGEVISSWINNKKFYVLINCQGLGYEIQTLKPKKDEFKTNTLVLWLEQIKREDSDLLYGFTEKKERDFFRELINIKGIGPQIGLSLLNEYSVDEIINSIQKKDIKLISSAQGIGKKMSERIFLELKNKIPTDVLKKENENSISLFNKEIQAIFQDIDITLKSLKYSSKERKSTLSFLMDNCKTDNLSKIDSQRVSTFEGLLKMAINYLEKNTGNYD